MWKTTLKKECATTKALCKSLLQGCKICFPQTQQAPSRHHFELSESTNNSRLVLPWLAENLKGWPGSRELPWNSSGIKLQCDPSCTTFLLMSLSHYLQSNPGLPQCRNAPCCIHPYNLMSLAPRCHKTRTPVATKKKPKWHLKPRTWLKNSPKKHNFLQIRCISRSPKEKVTNMYNMPLPKQRCVSCCCQVQPANRLL